MIRVFEKIKSSGRLHFKMATVDDDDVLDDDQLDVLLNFPPDIQEVIEQVF